MAAIVDAKAGQSGFLAVAAPGGVEPPVQGREAGSSWGRRFQSSAAVVITDSTGRARLATAGVPLRESNQRCMSAGHRVSLRGARARPTWDIGEVSRRRRRSGGSEGEAAGLTRCRWLASSRRSASSAVRRKRLPRRSALRRELGMRTWSSADLDSAVAALRFLPV